MHQPSVRLNETDTIGWRVQIREFKFIEIDPRVSASIMIPQVAGTGMTESFCHIIEGKPVKPDLSFKEGVKYRFFLPRETRYLVRHPSYILRFIWGL